MRHDGFVMDRFLDYYRIPFKVDEGDTWSDDKKKPIVALDGELMFDSSDIIDKLIKRIHPDYDLNAEEEKEWREWVDNHLEHVVLANLYRNVPETLKTMDWNTIIGNVNSFDRFVVKYSVIKLKKEHNITDERAALYGAVEQWVDALNGRQFLGGLNPNLADLGVFAILLPILHDQTGRDVIEQTRIRKWHLEMHRAYDEMELRLP
ncbi:hypothetical protein V8G54_007860 [Vigna mungo]|uniref:Glutathione S-transferase n=1 Tax=Vigna mungo TaxID=3915 RepID=A0AAQ3S8N8_VIGMU